MLAPAPFPDTERLAEARAAARDRAPDGSRLGRFAWAALADGVWLFPTAPVPEGRGLGRGFEIARAGAGVGPSFAYWIAHAVRQDLWRALRDLRGFWPVIRVEAEGSGLRVTAGGIAPGPVPVVLAARIAALPEGGRAGLWAGWAERKTNMTTGS